MEREFIIPSSLVQVIAEYLAQKPYREVAGLMQAVMTLKVIEAPGESQKATRAPEKSVNGSLEGSVAAEDKISAGIVQ